MSTCISCSHLLKQTTVPHTMQRTNCSATQGHTATVGPPFTSITKQPGELKIVACMSRSVHWPLDNLCATPSAPTTLRRLLFFSTVQGDDVDFGATRFYLPSPLAWFVFLSRVCVRLSPHHSTILCLLPFNWLFVCVSLLAHVFAFSLQLPVSATASVCVICNLKT